MMTSPQIAGVTGRVSPFKIAFASFVGTAIEWYDYFIYGSAAAIVFAPLFFPSFEAVTATLAAFATFSVGFIARPLGAIVMGHYGDRLGRRTVLVASLVIAGVATCLIGLLPTFETIGVWAPLLLVTLRFVQGFGVGGEWGGAVLLAVEHAPPSRRHFYGSFPQMGVPAGIILANLVFLAVSSSLDDAAFLAWGWRVPFLLSAALVIAGLVIRARIDESPEFAELRAADNTAKVPLFEAFRTHRRQILLAAASFVGNNTLGYILTAYLLSYGTSALGLGRDLMLGFTIASAAVWIVVIPLASLWADRIGRRRVLMLGSLALFAWAVILFPLLNTASPIAVLIGMVGLAITLGVTYGPIAAMFSDVFTSRIRYSASSFAYQLASILGGGIAPTVAVALFAQSGTSTLITLYLGAVTAISFIAVLVLTKERATPVRPQ